jgi:hypothetical protein
VGDAVRFLAEFAPAQLDRLREANPDPSAQAALQPDGAVLGGGDIVLDAAIDAAEAFLTVIDDAVLAAIRSARRTLNIAQWVELGGKLLALGSTAALITLLLRSTAQNPHRGEAIVLASMSFLSAAIPLIVSFMRGSITDPSGLQKQYDALKEAGIEAVLLRARFAAARNAIPRDRDELTTMIDATNAIARKTFGILTDLGHDVRPGFGGG